MHQFSLILGIENDDSLNAGFHQTETHSIIFHVCWSGLKKLLFLPNLWLKNTGIALEVLTLPSLTVSCCWLAACEFQTFFCLLLIHQFKMIENYNFIKIFSRARFKFFFFVLIFYHSVLLSAFHNLWQIMKVPLTSMVLLVPFKPDSSQVMWTSEKLYCTKFLGTDVRFLSIDVVPSNSLHCQHSNLLPLEVKLSQTFLSSVPGVLSGAQCVCAAPVSAQWL